MVNSSFELERSELSQRKPLLFVQSVPVPCQYSVSHRSCEPGDNRGCVAEVNRSRLRVDELPRSIALLPSLKPAFTWPGHDTLTRRIAILFVAPSPLYRESPKRRTVRRDERNVRPTNPLLSSPFPLANAYTSPMTKNPEQALQVSLVPYPRQYAC